MVLRTTFGCPHCGELWTPPLRPLPRWLADDPRHDLCSVTPSGTFTLSPDPGNRPERPVAVNVLDARGLTLHEDVQRVVGCCGVGYRPGLPNLRCAGCAREAGYRLSDGDHCFHAVYLPDSARVRARRDEPDDASLHATFTQRRDDPRAPRPDAGYDAALARFAAHPDALWMDDRQRPEVFPQLRDLAVEVTGTELRIALDGIWLRPPWPDVERDRLLALGAVDLPAGGAEEPLYWWSSLGEGGRERHEWHQWCVDGELCVGWRRGLDARFENVPQVAFRVPWELWELVWREALSK